ncbi:hypothetical protein JTB14_011601 [Gonioctena quinquepunctata]|nr:hypothetical protein JTB14_011601 [Gonioctena quinquepunctata]
MTQTSNYIAEFMQRMKITHQDAIQTIEATTDRVHGQFTRKPRNQDSASVIGYTYTNRLYKRGLTSKLAKEWIGPYRITHLRGVNARIEEIHGRKSNWSMSQTEAMFGHRRSGDQLGNVATRFRTHNREPPRRAEVQTVSGAGLQVAREIRRQVREKLTTGQQSFHPQRSQHHQVIPGGDCNNRTAGGLRGTNHGTQRTTGTPRTPTTGAEAGARREGTTLPNLERRANVGVEPIRTPDRRRAVPDYGTEFGDGWRGLFTPACWNQEGGGLSRGAEQPRGPQADLKEEEYLPNPISHQGRSPVSQDLVVFKH